MFSFLKKYLEKIYDDAMLLNDKNVCNTLLEFSKENSSILDVGCWDGVKTLEYAKNAKATKIYGIEIVAEVALEANSKGIQTESIIADKQVWPFPDESMDFVVSNQVIEHLTDVDYFIIEAKRVLKKGGILVTSTNNLSSWHNIFALIMGWAPFDLTNSSKKAIGIGNPIALHKGELTMNGDSWTHKTIFTTRWLNDWFSLFDLETLGHKGSGYYPFPASFGKFFKKHSAFITLANKKGE